MLHIAYDKHLWDEAQQRASNAAVLPGSHRGAAANQVGALGEVLVEDFLKKNGIPFDPCYSTSRDLIVAGLSIEIKTKDRTVAPEPHFDCTIPLYNHEHQAVDVYVFVSLKRAARDNRPSIERYTDAYIVGWANRHLMMTGKKWRAGEVDPSNNTKFWTDCMNRHISEIRTMQELAQELKIK